MRKALLTGVLVTIFSAPGLLAQGYVVHVAAPTEIAGGTSTPVTFSFTVTDPAINSLGFTLTPQQPAFVSVAPATTLTSTRGPAGVFPPLTFTITVAPNAPAGLQAINVQINVNGDARIDRQTFTFVVPSADFNLAVTPSSVALTAGESRTLNVVLTQAAFNAFRAAQTQATVTVAAPNGVSVTPSTFTMTVPGTQPVTVTVSPNVFGRLPLTFTATSGGVTHSARAEVQVLPSTIIFVPSAVTAPSLSTTLRAAGTNFSPAGTFVSSSPDVVVVRTVVYSPTLADVVVSVREGAAVGPRTLTFRNADGAVSTRSGTLSIVPSNAIGAPLGVTTAAIVFPPDGTVIGNGEALYPRAMLATSGTGTISGTWSVDGVPFDRFTANAGAGPVEVRSHVPVPPSTWGTHRIELVIESPRLFTAPAVSYTALRESVTRLGFYEPVERGVVETNPRIRWSLVPGATSYELELRTLAANGAETGATRIRTTLTEAKPGEAITGTVRYRVRAIFPGDVRGEPTPWRTAVFLPRKLSLRIDDAASGRVAWSGGTLGVVYRVEFERAGARCFDALTFAFEYRLPAGIAWRGCDTVRVRAVAPSGRVIGISEPRPLAAGFAPSAALARSTPSHIVEQEPRAESVAAARSAIAVRWNGDADAALLVDGVDVTPVAFRQPGSIRYDALLPLRAGHHVAALAMPAGTSEWSFTAEQEPPPAPAAAPAGPTYVLSPNGTVTWKSDAAPSKAAENFALSSKGQVGDVNAGSGGSLTGDLTYPVTQNPTSVAQTSRNWIAEGRAQYENVYGGAKFGLGTPDFTDGTTFLTALARPAVVARAGTSYGTFSYYEPIDPQVQGVVSATTTPSQRLRSLSWGTPEGKPYTLRFIGLDVPAADVGSGAIRTYGIVGGYTFSEKVKVDGEIARGTQSAVSSTSTPSQHGNAYRLGMSGTAAATTYRIGVSKVDTDFVSPANRVFSAGFNDFVKTDLSLARAFGKAQLSLTALHETQGRTTTTPHGTKHAATLSVISPLTARLGVDVSGGYTRDSAESTSLFPGGTDRLQTMASATLTETFTRIAVSEKALWSKTSDRVTPTNDETIHDLLVSANGAVWTNVTLTTSAGYTHKIASPILGTSDRWSLMVVPTFAVPPLNLALRPSISFDRTSTDVTNSRTRNEIYGATLEWNPPWLLQLVSGQLSGTLTRTATLAPIETRTQSKAAIASVTVHTKKERGMPMFAAPPPLPGTETPQPPEPAPAAGAEAAPPPPPPPPSPPPPGGRS